MKTAELRLIESIVESSPAIIFRWRIEAGWPVEYVSRNVAQLGYTRQDILSGRVSWPAITHPGDVPRLEQEIQTFLKKKIDRWSQTYRIRAKDGRYRWMRDWNLLLRGKKGVPRKIQGIILDVSAEKAAQARLENALEKVLSGFIPICAECKAIRDKAGRWQPVEQYLHRKSRARFTHGYCPRCAERVMKSLARRR